MNIHERLSLYRVSLEDAVARNQDFVIFTDPVSGKFVQFMIMSMDGIIIVDVPVAELNETTLSLLKPYMETEIGSKGELIALQKTIEAQQTHYAAEYTDWIFTKIFQLPETHEVKVKIFS